MRKVLAILTVIMVLGVLFSAIGCETVRGTGTGFGKDVENAGQSIQGK